MNIKLEINCFCSRAQCYLQPGGPGAQHSLPREVAVQEQGRAERRQQHHLPAHSQPERLPKAGLHEWQPWSDGQPEDDCLAPGLGPGEVMTGPASDVIQVRCYNRQRHSVIYLSPSYQYLATLPI